MGKVDITPKINETDELSDEQLSSIAGGLSLGELICPHCGSSNVIPYHSPTKGTAYLCSDCYYSFNVKK